MRVGVEFFGVLRERAGCPRTTRTLPDGATVATLLQDLATAYPALVSLLLAAGEPVPTLLVAVAEVQATATTPLHDGVEVLLLPPVSGGQ